MAEKIVIIGDGEFAEIAYQYFTYDSPYDVVAFSVEKPFLKNNELFGLPVVSFEELEQLYNPADYKVFVAVTYTQLNRVRARLFKEAKKKGYSAVSYISSKAFVWKNAKIGENCFIFENCVIQYHVEIGDNVVIWSGTNVGHRSKIKDNCFISILVSISGFSEVGESCFIGVNSCLSDHVKIAQDCIIGAGSVVIAHTNKGYVYAGNPAKALEKSSYKTFNVREE